VCIFLRSFLRSFSISSRGWSKWQTPYPQARVVTAYLKVDPRTVPIEEGFTRDVTEIGHFGTGDLEVSMRTIDDFVRAQPLFSAGT
jgi:predicted transport protein